jgi:hypothetical protein
LQQENVQLENFGRILLGRPDKLLGYQLKELEINDEEVLKTSNKKFHPIVIFSDNEHHKVPGILFEVTAQEILKADNYEVDDYKRIEVILESGQRSWVYVAQVFA